MALIDFDPLQMHDLQGRYLVHASAGTGKTHALTSLVLRLILDQGLPIQRILVVTFTEAATAELNTRIRTRIKQALAFLRGEDQEALILDPPLREFLLLRQARWVSDIDRLHRALLDLDLAPVYTIHGFCHRSLLTSAFQSGLPFSSEMVGDSSSLAHQVISDFWLDRLHGLSPSLVAYLMTRDACQPKAILHALQQVQRYPTAHRIPESPAFEPPSLVRLLAARAAVRACFDADKLLELGFLLRPRPTLPKTRLERQTEVEAKVMKLRGWLDADPFSLEKKAIDVPWIKKLTKETASAAHPMVGHLVELVTAYEELSESLRLLPLAFKLEAVSFLERELQTRKRAQRQLSFDDVLCVLLRALSAPGGESLCQQIRSNYSAVLIDEFQDTDPVQYRIFDLLFGGNRYPEFLIGDPKQAIYAFRGADVYSFLRVLSTTRPEQQLGMRVNYRTDPGLLRALEAIFGHPEQPFVLPGIDWVEPLPRPEAEDQFEARDGFTDSALEIIWLPRSPATPQGLLSRTQGIPEVAELVAGEIERLLASGCLLKGRQILSGDIAVLTRTNRQSVEVERALHARNIPAVVLAQESVFGTDEAKDLRLLLKGVLGMELEEDLRRGLSTLLVGLSPVELSELGNHPERYSFQRERFRHWHRIWQEQGLIQMFRRVLLECRTPQRVLPLVGGERHLTNWWHLAELCQLATWTDRLSPLGLLRWLSNQMAAQAPDQGSTTVEDSCELRLESDEAAVKVSTVHKSKGLEYPIVYCPFLWAETEPRDLDKVNLHFHDPAEANRLVVDLGSANQKAHLELARREALAERIRLLYVALTRARHRTTIVWGAFRDLSHTALAHLLYPSGVEVDTLSDAEHQRILSELMTRGRGAITVRQAEPSSPQTKLEPSSAAVVFPEPRRIAQPITEGPRISSFTSLTHGPKRELEDAVDDEDTLEDGLLVRDARESSAYPKRFDANSRANLPAWSPEIAGALEGSSRLAEFPRGSEAGQCLHEILENLDFQVEVPDLALISRVLRRHGFDQPIHQRQVVEGLGEILGTELGKPPWALQSIARSHRLNELEFHLPVAGIQPPGVCASELARVFAQHPSPELPPEYSRSVERLAFGEWFGYLKGFIDLVFVREDKYYVVDYKSNCLGSTLGDYLPERLGEVMAEAHYFLQYHLYCLAVHRFLGWRLTDYDYDRHFGGAYYLFLRGMSPSTAGRTGIYFERPPRSRLEALERLFGGGKAAT